MTRLSWDEIVRQHPDRWVAVKDAEMDGADVVSGEVVAALSDREMRLFRVEHGGADFVYRRTSEGDYTGPITSDISILVDEV